MVNVVGIKDGCQHIPSSKCCWCCSHQRTRTSDSRGLRMEGSNVQHFQSTVGMFNRSQLQLLKLPVDILKISIDGSFCVSTSMGGCGCASGTLTTTSAALTWVISMIR